MTYAKLLHYKLLKTIMSKINVWLQHSLDYTLGLSIFRIILSLIVIKNCIFYLPIADELFGPNAIVSLGSYISLSKVFSLPVLPFDVPFFPHILLISTIIFASAFMAGFFPRISGIILFLHLFILQMRNGFVLDGSDNIIAVTLPFLLLTNSFRHYSSPKSKIFATATLNIFPESIKFFFKCVALFGLLGFMLQIGYVYFFTALHKLQGETWLNGTAVYYTMRVDEFRATDWNIFLTKNHYFVVLSTYFTVFWELSFIFLIWFRQTSYIILILGFMLHVGIFIFMRIDNFSTIMIASYLVFIPNKDYYWIGEQLKLFYRFIQSKVYKQIKLRTEHGKLKI